MIQTYIKDLQALSKNVAVCLILQNDLTGSAFDLGYTWIKMEYLSHWSAMKFWQVPFSRVFFAAELLQMEKAEITVFERKQRYRRAGHQVHLCELPVPKSAKCIIQGQGVVSPEMLFLQLARQLDIQKLILLGILLCARPETQTSQTRPLPQPARLLLCTQPEAQAATPLTSKAQLIKFTGRMAGHAGRRKALRALKYVAEHCRSPLEACLYLFLSLPNALGGCGFGTALFDHRIKLNSAGKRILNQAYCYADLYFASSRLIVEYDSFSFHNSATAHGKDSERALALQQMRYKVVSVKTSQLYKPQAFEQLIRHLARVTGKRIRIRCKAYPLMFRHLRHLLPRRPKDKLFTKFDL